MVKVEQLGEKMHSRRYVKLIILGFLLFLTLGAASLIRS